MAATPTVLWTGWALMHPTNPDVIDTTDGHGDNPTELRRGRPTYGPRDRWRRVTIVDAPEDEPNGKAVPK